MKELLEETYGVMVFQEDVIKVAHHFAGLDMGEADVLRRAMSGKYRGQKEFERIREKFFANCKDLGHPDAIAKEVWRQIESFGGYSFSKAHSASFCCRKLPKPVSQNILSYGVYGGGHQQFWWLLCYRTLLSRA